MKIALRKRHLEGQIFSTEVWKTSKNGVIIFLSYRRIKLYLKLSDPLPKMATSHDNYSGSVRGHTQKRGIYRK